MDGLEPPLPPRNKSFDRKLWIALAIGGVLLIFMLMQQWDHKNEREEWLEQYFGPQWAQTEGVPPSGSIEQAQLNVAAANPQPDDHGAYFTAAQELVAEFGMALVWSDSEHTRCDISDIDEYTIAYYCEIDPSLVFLNRASPSYPDLLYSPAFLSFVRHELGHHVIDMVCGTTDPNFGGVEAEGLTNSYAVDYLGADPRPLDSAAREFTEYQRSAESDAAAANVNQGQCSL